MNRKLIAVLVVALSTNVFLFAESSKVITHTVDGVCEQVGKAGSNPSFKVTAGPQSVKTVARACSSSELDRLAIFSKTNALNLQKHFDPKTRDWNWKAVQSIDELVATECTILSESENKLALVKFNMKGTFEGHNRRRPSSASIFNFIQMKGNDLNLLNHYLTFQSFGEYDSDAAIKYVCDLNSDGIAEIILKDEGYAGYVYDIFSWKQGVLNKSVVESGEGE